MMDEVVLKCVSISTVTDDAALSMTPMYYLANVTPANDAQAALVQAVATYAGEAIVAADKRVGVTPVADSTLAQMPLDTEAGGGMSYVMKLADGRFVIVDGGATKDEYNARILWDYLMANNNYQKPVIAAWIFTHLDGDHTYNAFRFMRYYRDRIEVETVAYTFATADQFTITDADSAETKAHKENAISLVAPQMTNFGHIQAWNPGTQFIDLKQGNVLTFGDVQMKVFMDASISTGDAVSHNDYSGVYKFTFTQGTADTADDKTFLVLGDSTAPRTAAITSLGDGYDVKADVLQAAHHGMYGGVKATYEAVAPTITLIPVCEDHLKTHTSMSYYADYNTWLRNNSTVYYHDNVVVVNMKTLSVTTW